MAMIDCPECLHRISDQSNSCPSCGFVTNKRRISVRNHQVRKPKKRSLNIIDYVTLVNLYFTCLACSLS